MRGWAAAAALVASAAAALPAASQQSLPAVEFPGSQTPLPLPPRPPDTGKPLIYDPQFVAKSDSDERFGCSPLLSCRIKLLGVIQNNGAVELRATAFRW